MSDSSGVLTKAVFLKDAKDSDYGDAIAAGDIASDGIAIPLTGESISRAVTRTDDEVLDASAALRPSDVTFVDASGDVDLRGRYNGIEGLVAMATGFEHPDTSPETTGSLYRHVFECDPILARQEWLAGEDRLPSASWLLSDKKVRSCAVVVSKQVSDHAITGAMVQSMKFSLSPQGATLNFSLTGRDVSRANYVNANWPTLPDSYNILFSAATVYLGSIDGTSLAYAALNVSNIDITLTNNLKADDQDTGSDEYKIEPDRDGLIEVSGTITLPRYTSTGESILDRFRDDTEMKLRIDAQKPTTLERFQIFVPRLKFDAPDAPTTGRELRTLTLPFTGYRQHDLTDTDNPFNAAAPDTWNALLGSVVLKKTGPLVAMIDNAHSTNILTEV